MEKSRPVYSSLHPHDISASLLFINPLRDNGGYHKYEEGSENLTYGIIGMMEGILLGSEHLLWDALSLQFDVFTVLMRLGVQYHNTVYR